MKYILIIIILLFSIAANTQDIINSPKQKQNFIIAATYGNGNIIGSNKYVRGENKLGERIENYQFFALKAIWHNPDYTDWQKVYKGPYYGFGMAIGDFYKPQEIGRPISYYAILGIPAMRWKKLELYTEFQFGGSHNFKQYDSISNPYNNVIGSNINFCLDIAMKLYYNISPRMELGAGVDFTHFSNCGFKQPNKGFNLYSPFAELRYRFNDRPNYKSLPKPGRVARSDDLYIMIGFGDPQPNSKSFFNIGGLSAIYFNQLSNVSKIGFGTDFNYWSGLNEDNDKTTKPKNIENLTIGFVIQPEVMISRMTLVGGFGMYAKNIDYGNFIKAYQRLGVRCDLYKDISIGMNVRAVDFIKAEFFEFNLGYRFRWMK